LQTDPLSLLYFALAAGWVLLAAGRLFDLLHVHALPRSGTDQSGASRPIVTAVVTARDEERRIESTVRGLLAQEGAEVRIVVVDDRSSDATADILRRLADDEPRLEIVRVTSLPAGWLGKPHACQLGARRATGDWILFIDADVRVGPDVIARAVAQAERRKVDHVCLLPGEERTTMAVRTALINFFLAMLVFAGRANRDRRFSFIGVGAFNLVRAGAYRAIGGHESLRLEVIDDLKLGWLLRRAGYRSRVYGAPDDVEVRWAPTVPDLVRALEKNFFALLGFNPLGALLMILALGGWIGLSIAGIASGGATGVAVASGVISMLIPARIVARRAGWGWPETLLSPLAGPLLLVALAWSTIATLARGGVAWRGTVYPLQLLRRGRVRFRDRGQV
jgi:hypothetical protein